MHPRSLSTAVLGIVVMISLWLSTARTATAADHIVGVEHTVVSVSAAQGTPIKIHLWEKRLAGARDREFAAGGRIVLLAHSSTTPGRVTFDLQVARAGLTHSLMDYLAERGFDVFAIEYQNYGMSERHDCGLCVTAQVAANDLNAAVDHIRRIRGVERVHLLGWSWGTVTSGLFAMQHPARVDRLVLFAPPVWRGPKGAPPVSEFRTVTEETAAGLFEGESAEPGVVRTFAREAATAGSRTPNGAQVDMRTRLPLTDPRHIAAPTMIIVGARDRRAPSTQPELPGFFAELATSDKQLVIVPDGGHALHLEKQRARFFAEVVKWFAFDSPRNNDLTTPARR